VREQREAERREAGEQVKSVVRTDVSERGEAEERASISGRETVVPASHRAGGEEPPSRIGGRGLTGSREREGSLLPTAQRLLSQEVEVMPLRMKELCSQ